MADPIEVLRKSAQELVAAIRAVPEEKLLELDADPHPPSALSELADELESSLASLSAPKPSGEWVLVPREPSREMEAAAEKHRQEAGGWLSKDPWTWAGAFRAMLAAAPKPERAEAVYQLRRPAHPDPNWFEVNKDGFEAFKHAKGYEARVLYTAPPRPQASAPVGVPDCVIVLLNHLETLMDEGKLAEDAIPVAMWNAVSCYRPAQQPAAMNPEDVHVEAYPEQFGGFRVGSPRGIKVTHKSGLIVISTKERSAHANRDVAMRSLAWALAGQQQGGTPE